MVLKQTSSVVDQVYRLLVARIKDGTYPIGSRLPTENDLVTELGVGRSSIREALKKLEARGGIYKLHGIGTYVSETAALFTLPSQGFLDFCAIIDKSGRRSSMVHTKPIFRAANPDEAKALNLIDKTEVVEINQLFLADDTPVLHASYILPMSRIKPSVNDHEIDSGLFFPDILSKYFRGQIGSNKAVIHSTIGDPEVKARLKLKDEIPTLRLFDHFFDKEGAPIALDVIDVNDHAFDLYAFYIFD